VRPLFSEVARGDPSRDQNCSATGRPRIGAGWHPACGLVIRLLCTCQIDSGPAYQCRRRIAILPHMGADASQLFASCTFGCSVAWVLESVAPPRRLNLLSTLLQILSGAGIGRLRTSARAFASMANASLRERRAYRDCGRMVVTQFPPIRDHQARSLGIGLAPRGARRQNRDRPDVHGCEGPPPPPPPPPPPQKRNRRRPALYLSCYYLYSFIPSPHLRDRILVPSLDSISLERRA